MLGDEFLHFYTDNEKVMLIFFGPQKPEEYSLKTDFEFRVTSACGTDMKNQTSIKCCGSSNTPNLIDIESTCHNKLFRILDGITILRLPLDWHTSMAISRADPKMRRH